jgi:diguanylate cyclase (GGDEF)-like protein/PAS domain S-box-containing protein
LNIILQFYGLSYLLLGLLILVWPKQESEYSVARILWLLGAFGLTHSLVEWMELWRDLPIITPVLDASEPTVLLVSYLFLFEFGRRLTRSTLSTSAQLSLPGHLLAPWIYIVVLGLILQGAIRSSDVSHDLTIMSRYYVGFAASVLTSVGLFLYWHRFVKSKTFDGEYKQIKFAFYSLSISFIAFGVLGGLIVPRASWFPASVINDEWFIEMFHFPIEIARAVDAFIMAISALYVLRIFDIETWGRLVAARAASERDSSSLKRASRQNEILLRTASDGIHVLDLDGNVVEANDAFCQMLGYTREEVLNMNVRDWDAHFSPEELKNRIPMFIDKRAVFETRHRHRDGRVFDVEISTVGVQLDDRTLLYCSSRDVTDRKHAEKQLRLIAQVFDRSAEGAMITDASQIILMVNDAFTTVTGYTREDVIGKTPATLQSGKHGPDFYQKMWAEITKNGWWQGEIWNRRKNGELYLEWLSINAVKDDDGKIINYIGMFSDITLIKESRQRMEFLATHDDLTKLPNRNLFNDHLRFALARSARADNRLALLFVDLDDFKIINDTLGHEEGDALLTQVGTRLKGCAREEDIVARLGGDEFVVLLEIEHRDEASLMAKRILESFAASFCLQGHECFITPSIGISVFPEDATDPKVLMRHADTAMYRAKEHGKNTYMFFTSDMAEHISRRMIVENSLRLAIQNGELLLEYQPQINLANGEVMGIEALLRWRSRDETILPSHFIKIAEESGLVIDIDEWVIAEVCRQINAWDEAKLPPLRVSINISARHFRRPDIFPRITRIVALANINPNRLCLEITEGVLMDAEGTKRILHELHEVGFRVSVDDFGTGFSSLSYLKRFPIDEIKIDHSFVKGIADDSDDRAITTAIIAMAHELGLRTVAEGVETAVQHNAIKSLGCDIGQGYLFAKPMPAALLQEWLLLHNKQ